ncbi:MAG: cysteine desulfurase [Clostridia bacterium]|nr:cysteine desulfurase [Clostridia bacterium]
MKECYLDNSATTKPCEKAIDNMLYALSECWGNPSSLHDKGIEADELLLKARKAVAAALSADEKEIYFTSGGTEGNNLAIFGAAYAGRRKGNRVITTSVEHPSVQKAFDKLQSKGFEVVRLSTDSFGRVSKEALYEAVDEKTILVSMMYVNNEVGAIEPVEEIAKAVKLKNAPALIHVDAVQAFGKLPINVRKLGADLVTVSSHKIHGPKGVGALYIKNGTKIKPVAVGGGQEKDIRPGTEPMPAIAGFLGAVESLTVKESLQKVTALRDSFIEKLRGIEGVTVNSPDDALPYIVNLSLHKLNSETVLNFMSGMGIYISSGSACSKGHKSEVLTAMGLSDEIINSSLRVSLSRYTTAEELDFFAEAAERALKTLARRK